MKINTPKSSINVHFAASTTTPISTATKAELAMYHHQLLGNPRKDTLLRALRKHPSQFETFPGLSYALISTHLPPSVATEKGHMIMARKELRSTRTMTKKLAQARRDISNYLPAEEVCLAEEDEIYCYATLGDSNINALYGDLTGQFPVKSYDGRNYIFIAYVYKLNAIFMIPMKSHDDKSMITAHKEVYAKLEKLGHKPQLRILDNECSRFIENFLEEKGTKRHHIAPHNHHVNAAKPAVKTAKYHLIAALAMLDTAAQSNSGVKW